MVCPSPIATAPIKLIACDLDGTTLTSARRPHPETFEAIRRAEAAGVLVVFASGRIYTSMLPFVEMLGAADAMICSNGGQILGPGQNELACYPVEPGVLDAVLDYAIPLGVHVNVNTRRDLHILNDSEWSEIYLRRLVTLKAIPTTIEEARKMDLIKVSIVDDPEHIQGHIAALRERIGDSVLYTESEPEYIEMSDVRANKGSALRILAEHLEIEQESTAAIGDYLNDLEMVRWAGLGGAVGNATDLVLESADVVAPRNDDGGVAWFIDWVLANRV